MANKREEEMGKESTDSWDANNYGNIWSIVSMLDPSSKHLGNNYAMTWVILMIHKSEVEGYWHAN